VTRDEWALIRQVLEYFLRHPETADSLEGIARWRLSEERARQVLQSTQVVLEWLVASGYLERIESTAAAPLFRLNRARMAQAQQLVVTATEEGQP
jgi:hypothetical protein